MSAEFLADKSLLSRHGFFTRNGGVSAGPYASLNCSLSSRDAPENLAENRRRVAASFDQPVTQMLGVSQVHGNAVVVADAPWPAGAGARADALVTAQRGIILSVITADCAPVLFEDHGRGIVGAAHAGWRGAVAGVLEATIAAMIGLGAARRDIRAVIGPCIAQDSYETSEDFYGAVMAASAWAEGFFRPGRPGHRHFNLPGYCAARLRDAGIAASGLGLDTVTDELRFFSHRRRTLRGDATIGHQVSAIMS